MFFLLVGIYHMELWFGSLFVQLVMILQTIFEYLWRLIRNALKISNLFNIIYYTNCGSFEQNPYQNVGNL